MKRKLFLVISILVLIFTFSSCQIADWLLGVVYPPGDGDRKIIVDFGIDAALNTEQKPVVVAVIPIFEKKLDDGTITFEIDAGKIIGERFWNQHYVNWEFNGLGPLAYRVIAFYDANDNKIPECSEPSIELKINNKNLFDFRNDVELKELTGKGFLENRPAADPKLIGLINGGSCENASFDIIGPTSIDPTNTAYQNYSLKPKNNDLHIDNYSWKLMDPDRKTITVTYYYYPDGSSVNIDFSDTNPPLSDFINKEVYLSVDATLKNADGTKTMQWISELKILVTSNDPGFNVIGPTEIMQSATGKITINIQPRSTRTIKNIFFLLYDFRGYSVMYNGSYDWVLAASNANSFDLDLGAIYPALVDASWDNGFIDLYIWVDYNDGSYYVYDHFISLIK